MKVAPDHPFSNGTEGRAWESAWESAWCANDHVTHVPPHGFGDGCQLLADAMCGMHVAEWTSYDEEAGFTLPATMTCSAFRECACNERTEYPPIPEPTGGIPVIYVGRRDVPWQRHVEQARAERERAQFYAGVDTPR